MKRIYFQLILSASVLLSTCSCVITPYGLGYQNGMHESKSRSYSDFEKTFCTATYFPIGLPISVGLDAVMIPLSIFALGGPINPEMAEGFYEKGYQRGLNPDY